MYDNMNKNQTIDYDANIVSKIKEMIKEGFENLKSFVKINSNEITIKTPNFEFYNELDKKFDEISLKLKELKLCDEFNYFLSISDYILYIVHQNSMDSTFGHCNFALELLEFFMELFTTNVNFYNSLLKITEKKFKKVQTNFKQQFWEYRSHFYCNIYQPTGEFSEEEMYEIHKSLRD